MTYNSEDKITFEELSPSLQNLIKSAASKTEVENLYTRINNILDLLTNVRFDIVDKLEDIEYPVNGKNMVIAGTDSKYYLYFYYNNRWNKIPTAVMDLNQQFLVTVSQSPHQHIMVKYNNIYYTQSFKAKINSDIEVTITSEEGYTHGNLSCPNFFSLIEDISIFASPAIEIPKYNIIVTPKPNQSIEIIYNGISYINQSVYNILRGKSYSVSNQSTYGWTKGDLIVSENSSYQYGDIYEIYGDTTITATDAVLSNCNVSIPSTINQKIIFTYIDPDTGQSHSTTVSTLSTYFTVPYYSEYSVTAEGFNGYLPGTLNTTSGRVTSDITITITAAKKTYNKEIFDTSGTVYWTAPSYITKVHALIAGAGGGCHREEIDDNLYRYVNGGNGEQIDTVLQVVKNTRYKLVIGKAGISNESSGDPTVAFNITANGGGVNGVDAGNGEGGKGDIVNKYSGRVTSPAKDGWVILEYGTDIEREEVS